MLKWLRTLLFALAALGLGAAVYVFAGAATASTATPAFSSLRTDPQGASVWFGALARAGVRVARGYSPEGLLAQNPASTVAYVLAPGAWENNLDGQLDDFARRGGRVVLAQPPTLEQTVLGARLGASLKQAKPPAGGAPGWATPVAGTAPTGALALPLINPGTSLRLSPAWTAFYRHGAAVYLATRADGRGSIVLASEATFLANDNLARAPDPALLAWCQDGRPNAYVDETLHGLGESRGIVWLLGRYRLQTALLWLLLALALLVWNQAARLELPAERGPRAGDAPRMVESARAGYARLLQRAIPAAELLPACWRLYARRQPRRGERRPEIEALLLAPGSQFAAVLERFEAARRVWSASAKELP